MKIVHICITMRCVRCKNACFFLKGNCLKGDTCPYSHSQDPEQPEKPQEEENTCSICYNPCGVNRRKFGLLSHCDHVFCLECIRTWRDKKKESTSSHSHTCPICRVKSHFVIPSYSFATGTQKKEIEEQYKSILKSIPCKHFNFGKGTCPFYNNCFYVHLNPDGTPAPVTKPTPAQKKNLPPNLSPWKAYCDHYHGRRKFPPIPMRLIPITKVMKMTT